MEQEEYILQAMRQMQAAINRRLPTDQGVPFSVFARKRLKIRTVTDEIVTFKLRDIQRRYLAAKRLSRMKGKPARYLLLKFRRGGFTTVEQGVSYERASRNRNANVLTLAQDGGTTARLFKIPTLMHERDDQAPPIKGPGNKYELHFPTLNSNFYVGTAAGNGPARGETLSRTHWSEVAWSCLGHNQIEKQRTLLSGLTEATSHGEVILETTPKGSELFRELYMDAKMGKNDWTPIFLAWHMDQRHRMPISDERHQEIVETLSDEERRLVQAYRIDTGQIAWRRFKLRELKHLFYQEYPDDDVTCWLMSGTSYFNTQILLGLGDQLDGLNPMDYSGDLPRPTHSEEIPGGYRIIWEEPQPGVEYCAGVDTSEGLPGCDPNGIGVMRRDTGKMVASIHGMFDPRELARLCGWVVDKYNPLLGIERNNHGHAVIQKVIDMGISTPHTAGGNLYHHNYSRPFESDDDKQGVRAGWNTTSITRPVMLSNLRDYVSDASAIPGTINDRHFVTEAGTFSLQSDGKFAADSGSHDDTVMKWAICNQMRTVDWHRQTFTDVKVSRFG